MSITPYTDERFGAQGPDQFGDWNIIPITGDSRLAVAAVVSNMRPAEEVEANARLFTQAAVMAEIIKTFLVDSNGFDEVQLRARYSETQTENIIYARNVLEFITGGQKQQ